MSLRTYLFGTDVRDGRIARYSRFEIWLAALLAFALMFAVAFTTEGTWTPTRAMAFIVVAACVCLAPHRRFVVGAALSVLTARLILSGVLIGNHAFEAGLFALVLGSITWWVLKGCDD